MTLRFLDPAILALVGGSLLTVREDGPFEREELQPSRAVADWLTSCGFRVSIVDGDLVAEVH